MLDRDGSSISIFRNNIENISDVSDTSVSSNTDNQKEVIVNTSQIVDSVSQAVSTIASEHNKPAKTPRYTFGTSRKHCLFLSFRPVLTVNKTRYYGALVGNNTYYDTGTRREVNSGDTDFTIGFYNQFSCILVSENYSLGMKDLISKNPPALIAYQNSDIFKLVDQRLVRDVCLIERKRQMVNTFGIITYILAPVGLMAFSLKLPEIGIPLVAIAGVSFGLKSLGLKRIHKKLRNKYEAIALSANKRALELE